MRNTKNQFSLYRGTRIILCAFSAFALLLLWGTYITDCGGKIDSTIHRPFDMYEWHYSTTKQGVVVADICGRNEREDNAFIHIRKEPSGLTEVIFWLADSTLPNARYRMATEFGEVHKTFKTKTRFTNNNSVLYMRRPFDLIELMKKNKSFKFMMLKGRDTLNCYTFQSFEELQWH